MKITALIMAGGRGERFWPKSRKTLPKQFLSIADEGKTMIQMTVERIFPLIAMEDIYIATNGDYKNLVLEQLPEIPAENILCEPIGRNTAPCIGLGAIHIGSKYNDAIMIVLPSDHLVKYNDMFVDVLKDACNVAENGNNLATIGITPSYPETGYGYIKFDNQANDDYADKVFKVKSFVEKPDIAKAKEYLAEKNYLWNSGMFVWKISSILYNLMEFMPDTYKRLQTIKNAIGTEQQEAILEKEFTLMESQSIDYGIMEKASDIYIIQGNFGWDDVGSWLAVGRIRSSNQDGNTIEGNVITVNTKNCIIEGSQKLIAAAGVVDIIIVDTEDALLICSKENAGDIKKILEKLKNKDGIKYI